MTQPMRGSTTPLDHAYDAALVDLAGVPYRGPHPVPEAAPALVAARAAGMRIVFVTNNASRGADEVARHLTGVGIDASPAEVMTAGQAAARMLEGKVAPGAKVLVVGGTGLRAVIEERGFVVVDSADDHPAAVVQGWHPDVGWRQLAEAAYAVRDGAYFLATNLDLTLPNDRGLAPGNGSLVQAVVTASGVEPDSAGKPAPAMFHQAAALVGSKAPLVIGDRLDTDLAGANAAGFAGLLVLTGVSSARDAVLAAPFERPTFIGETIAALGQSHPRAERHGDWWQVGQATAKAVKGELTVAGPGGIDAIRAACAAAWAAADEGDQVHVESLPSLALQ